MKSRHRATVKNTLKIIKNREENNVESAKICKNNVFFLAFLAVFGHKFERMLIRRATLNWKGTVDRFLLHLEHNEPYVQIGEKQFLGGN